MEKSVSIGVQIAACVLLAAYLWSLYALYQRIDTPTEVQWSRFMSLFTSLEAIAFAAAGALFGTHVQKERVAKAEEGKETAKTLAMMVEKSSTDMAPIFEHSAFDTIRAQASINTTRDEARSTHEKMRKLARDILLDRYT